MSIESDLQSINTTLVKILAFLENPPDVQAAPAAPAVVGVMNANPFVPPEQQFAAAPVVVPVAAAPVAPAVVAVPVPAPAPASVGGQLSAPFQDGKGLTAYCMEKYKQLGPVKGGMIQTILGDLGATNLGQLPVEKYSEFFNRVELIA